MLVVVWMILFYLFDVLIGGYITGEHVGVGNGSMCVCVRDLFEAVCCRFRPRCRVGLCPQEEVVLVVCGVLVGLTPSARPTFLAPPPGSEMCIT